jgi:hypothetical protein
MTAAEADSLKTLTTSLLYFMSLHSFLFLILNCILLFYTYI